MRRRAEATSATSRRAALILGALGALAASVLPVLATAREASGAPAGSVPAGVVPFTAATATLQAGGSYRVSWSAPADAGSVRVYAGTGPSPATTDLVGRGGSSAAVTVSGLATAPRWYFTLAPSHGHDLVVADRSLGLADAPNFRDAGGYRTADGQWVRMGVVYRSDTLSGLSAADEQDLTALHVDTVVDLRTTAESTSSPDRLPPGVALVPANVFGSDPGVESAVETAVTTLLSNPSAQSARTKPADMVGLMDATYRDMIALPSARHAYATLYDDIAAVGSGDALVMHCTAGKDRTGWGTAALLLELGVPERTVMQDYLLSNTYALDEEYAPVLRSFESGGGNPALLTPILGVERSYLDLALATMKKDYGSIGAYFTRGLGLSRRTIDRLRAELLVGRPS